MDLLVAEAEDPNLTFDEFDEARSPRPEQTEFDAVSNRFMSRRAFNRGTVALGVGMFLLGTATGKTRAAGVSKSAPFEPVVANTLDTVTVPDGYSWHDVISWGDPLWSDGNKFDPRTRGTAASQARAFGDNNDGMSLFVSGERLVLAVNNEYVNRGIFFGNRRSRLPENADDVFKGQAGHGVSIFEIAQVDGYYGAVLDSQFNRRITPDTPMDIVGPARGHDALRTAADPAGTTALGTWNNCANGHTPWGTYLTCEENFNGYFSSSSWLFKPTPEMQRYGIGHRDWGYSWAKVDDRFDVSKHPNECNRVGYVVEIDPLDPASRPRKLTALGRFKHENAEVVVADNGHVVVYMGDDERGEFLYKFVSAKRMAQNAQKGERNNRGKLLEEGQLFAAKFDDDGRGRWLALTPEATGMRSKEDICTFTRIAASRVGATTMDRPEWVAANPLKPEVYCTLTNNKNRGRKPNAGGDKTPVGGPNPRKRNIYGQIVRWMPDGGDHSADHFSWDLYVVAGNPAVHKGAKAGSSNVTHDNMFNAPDGIKFDSRGGLWIQTDGNSSNSGDFAGHGNNQMLLGDPVTGDIKRFLVGPRGAEITGVTWTPDRKTMFVGIQHPGASGDSRFPGSGESLPRSTIIAISRDDGERIG